MYLDVFRSERKFVSVKSLRKTYEAGGTGGLSLMTNSLSISKIVWRTVAEVKHEKSVQSAITKTHPEIHERRKESYHTHHLYFCLL